MQGQGAERAPVDPDANLILPRLGQRQPLAGLRGRVHAFRGMQLIVTYHPAYLLRDPRQKKEAWADLQIAMRELGLKAPAKG